jgi:pimeloyl-ACP methyl ester carboxylesterase
MLSAGNLLAMPPAMIPLIFARVFVKESEEKERYIAKQTAKLKAPDYPAYVRALVQAIELSMASYLLDELPKIGCPILLLAGRKDAVVPLEQAEAAARRAPRAELQIMENSGHVPQLEDAEELVKRVTEFAYKKAQEPIKQSS